MGGGKGGGNTWAGNQQSTVSIPPEVLARYNAVNARAENVAQNPFQTYDGSFVSPLNLAQNTATNNLFNSLQAYNPYYDTAQQFVWNGLNNSAPYYDTANQTIGGALGTASQYAGQGLGAIQGAFNAAQPFNAAASGLGNAAYASAQPFNAAASQGATSAYNSAQPLNAQASSQINQALSSAAPYMGYAGNLAMAGTGAVNPNNLDIARYFSPYNDAVVKSTLGLLDQQQAQQQNALKSNAIMAGAYGGDRSNIASAVLSGQQGLARSQVASDLYNQMYNQALGTAQQQQGLYLSADQANRAALASGASNLANIGNLGFNQGLGAAQGQMSLANNMFNQGLGAAGMQLQAGNQIYNQGMGNAGLQAQIGNQLFGQGYQTGTGIAGIGQGLGGLGLQGANQYQGLGQQAYNQGLGASAQFGNLAGQQNQMQLASAQALLGAGTVGQQTDQANLQAQYNQFLQQQAYPFQVAQFLANIAMGTGSLSGSTTTTSANQPQPFFSDERLKEDIREIGKTKDGIPIISFKYKGSPHTQIGMRAQDVENVRPEAVGLAGGYKTVDYDRATKRASGGLVPANDDGREGFAAGGYNGMMDPVMAQILAAHSGMYPGGAGRPGMDTGPRGLQLAQLPTGKLAVAQPMQLKQPEPQAKTLLDNAEKLKGLYGMGMGAYTEGKDALVGSAPVMDKNGNVTKMGTEGLIGRDGSWSSTKGWFGGLGGGANANTPTSSIKTEELPPASNPTAASAAPADSAGVASAALRDAPVDESLVAAAEDVPVDDIVEQAMAYAWRGGRMRRKAGGGMPYAAVDTYVPDEGTDDYSDNFKKSQALADEALADARRAQERGSGKGGDKGLGRAAGSLVGMGIGSMFGAPMLGSAAGGLFGGLFNRGGRAGYDEGGGIDPDEARKIIDASERFGRERAGLDPVAAVGANVVPFEPVPRNALLDRVHSTPDTSLRHTSMLPQDRLPGMSEYEWRNTVREAPPTAGLAPPSPPVTVPATPPSGARGSATVADATAPGLNPSPPPVTPDQARAAVNQVASTIPTPPSPGLNPPVHINTPPGFRSPGFQDSGGFDRAVNRTFGFEGGYNASDANGAPVNMGINQAYHPGVDVKNLTRDQAREIYKTQYWDAIGGDRLDPKIQGIAFDTAVISGPAKAKELLEKSGGDPARFLALRQQFEEGLIKSDPARYARYQQAWANRRNELGRDVASLNVQNGPQDGGGLNPAMSLQPAADAAPKPPRDFLDRAGDFIDRNERPIMAGLSFLGNMLASPSRTLAGSIGSGLAAAAPQYLSAGFREKELGQGQQRIDITRTAQLITMYNQLRGMIASQIAGNPAGKADPETVAQANRIAQMIAEGSKTGPNGLPTIGGGATGGPQQPAEGPAAPAPTQIPPGTGAAPAALPGPASAGPAPTAPPASPNLPPSMQQPGSIEASFYERLAPDNNPSNLRMRARNMEGIAPEQAAALRARADQIDAQIQQTGKGVDRNGNVVMSEAWPQIEAAQRRTVENPAFMREQQTAFQARQVMAENVRKIAETVRDYEPGKLNDLLADIQGYANGLGIPVRSTPTMNAEAYQKFIKEAASVISSSPTGDQRTDDARAQLRAAFATPNLQPGAVRSILAQTLGKFEMFDDQYRDVTEKLPRARYMDIPLRYNELEKEKPLDTYTSKYLRDTPVLGDLPKDAGGLKDGFVYMVTPTDIARFLNKDPKAMREAMGGSDKPQAARVIIKDGIPTFKSPP